MPTNFDRPVDSTNWDVTKHWMIIGPLTAQQWEYLISGWIATGPVINWRLLGGYFQIWPPLGVNENLAFEYVTKFWVLATTPTTLRSTPRCCPTAASRPNAPLSSRR